MPKVSVIIPVFNEEDSVGECLASLGEQSYKDMEIIVVDDGSSDRTLDIVKSFDGVKIFTQGHGGAGAARNLGSEYARGEILVFVDADMTFDRDFIKNLINPIGRTIIGTFSKEERLANKDNIWAMCWNLNRGLPPTKMHPINYPDYQKVFRAILKSEFKRAGGFNEKGGYTDDYTLSEKLKTMAVAAPGAVFYHKNPDSLAEVFVQSRWMAKRKYKLGILGYLAALLRVNIVTSVIVGLILSVFYFTPQFFVFKLVSDFGQFVGVLEYAIWGKVSK